VEAEEGEAVENAGMVVRALCVALVLLVGGVAGNASAQEIHAPHCLLGCPLGGPVSNDLIVREIYALSSNDQTKFADWVATFQSRG